MPHVDTLTAAFLGGEISPYCGGRADLKEFQDSAKTIENFIVKPQGGLIPRPGTWLLSKTQDQLHYTRQVEFQISAIAGYLLEFAPGKIYFRKNGQLILSAGVPYSVNTPYTDGEIQNLQYCQSVDQMIITHPSHPTNILSFFGDINWTIAEAPFTDGPYLPVNPTQTAVKVSNYNSTATISSTAADFGGAVIGTYVEFTNPVTGNPQIAVITAVVDANHVTVTVQDNCLDPTDPASSLVYGGGNLTASLAIFSNANVNSFIRDYAGAWYHISAFISTSQVAIDHVLTLQATTGFVHIYNQSITATVTASDAIFTMATDVGRWFRMNFNANQVWGKISATTSTTKVDLTLSVAMPLNINGSGGFVNNGQTVLWRLGAWSITTGYPSIATFFGGRLFFAANPMQPDTVWGSNSGDYFNMSPTNATSNVVDSNAVTFTIASEKLNTIKWLSPGSSGLHIGTVGDEWLAFGSTQATNITPTSINVNRQSSWGSVNVRPLVINVSHYFLHESGIKFMEQAYDFYTGLQKARDITGMSEHMLRRGNGHAVYFVYQSTRNSIVWFLLSDGTLAALTINRELNTYAWHHHTIGGPGAFVESIACMRDFVGNAQDILYMTVRRMVNGTTIRTVESMSLEYTPLTSTDKNGYNFLDCATLFNAGSTKTFQVPELPNETVTPVVDGAVRLDVHLDGAGNGALSTSGTYITVGYNYQSVLTTQPVEGGNQQGTAQGKLKRPTKMQVRVLSSLGFKYGWTDDLGNLINPIVYSFRKTTDKMDMSPPLRTADVELPIDESFNRSGNITIVRHQPYPLNILCIAPMFDTTQTT